MDHYRISRSSYSKVVMYLVIYIVIYIGNHYFPSILTYLRIYLLFFFQFWFNFQVRKLTTRSTKNRNFWNFIKRDSTQIHFYFAWRIYRGKAFLRDKCKGQNLWLFRLSDNLEKLKQVSFTQPKYWYYASARPKLSGHSSNRAYFDQ